jgi:hypothetical protein
MTRLFVATESVSITPQKSRISTLLIVPAGYEPVISMVLKIPVCNCCKRESSEPFRQTVGRVCLSETHPARYEVNFSANPVPGFRTISALVTARKHGGLITYFQINRDYHRALYRVN